VVVSPDGARVLVVGDAGSAVVQLPGGKAESVDPEATGVVSVDPSGQFAAVGGARVTIWNLATGRPAFSVPRPVNAMAWSGACGREPRCTLATVGESADAWQPESRRHVELVDQTNAQAVAISADGTTVVTAGWGPTVAVWRLRPIFDDSGRSEIAAADIATAPNPQCASTGDGDLHAVSPDGKLVVTHPSEDGTTTVCAADDGSVVAQARIRGNARPSDAVAIDDQGNLAIGGGDGIVERYRREGGTFAPGRAIDVKLGNELVEVTSLAYHAGTIAAGIRPAALSTTARVFVWPVDDGGTPAQFETDHLQVAAVALLGDRAQDVAAAGRDQTDGPVTLQIWETATLRRLGYALRGLSGDVVALGGDVSAVAAADSSGTAYRWELGDDPTRDVCAIVGRPLTEGEWSTLAGGVLEPYTPIEVCAESPVTSPAGG
jgi:WD40 repeat protein